MKHISYAVFAFVAVAVVAGVVLFQSTKAQAITLGSSNSDIVTAQIELRKPVALDTFLSAGANYSFDEMVLESSFLVNNEPVHDFYVVDTKNKNKDIKADYIKSRKGFLTDHKGIKPETPTNTQNLENISVTSFRVTGKKGSIDGMKKGFEVAHEEVANVQAASASQAGARTKPKEAQLLGDGIVSLALSTTPMYLSVPKTGTSYFYPSTAGGRFVEQDMKWSTINFASDQTYEHKVYLYNYDRKTYLDGASTAYPGCYPAATYAASNWPTESKPYLDTRFAENLVSCEIDELSYTIGAAQASALQPNVDYYTYIRTANGNDTVDKFKLQGQVGYRNPSTCYTTWCSAKYKIYSIIPAWSTNVPGTQAWTYNGQVPDAPSMTAVNPVFPTTTSLNVYFIDNTYDETNILIERKIGTSGSWVSLGGFGVLTGIGNWTWTNTSLSANTTYCYRLKAINAVGSSPYSNEVCGTTLR